MSVTSESLFVSARHGYLVGGSFNGFELEFLADQMVATLIPPVGVPLKLEWGMWLVGGCLYGELTRFGRTFVHRVRG